MGESVGLKYVDQIKIKYNFCIYESFRRRFFIDIKEKDEKNNFLCCFILFLLNSTKSTTEVIGVLCLLKRSHWSLVIRLAGY